jgi:hypothetical protein
LRFSPRSVVIIQLLNHSSKADSVEVVLFVSLKDDNLGAGPLIFRHVHLIWAGTNRDMKQERVGEACLWGIVDRAIGHGCTRYNLEGIDLVNNPSVYEFKKRLGGDEIILHGHLHKPLNFIGRSTSRLIRLGANGYAK